MSDLVAIAEMATGEPAAFHARRMVSGASVVLNMPVMYAPQDSQNSPSRASTAEPRQMPQYVMPVVAEIQPRRVV